MAKHASTTPLPFKVPALYASAETRDYSLVLLVPAWVVNPDATGELPVAVGVLLAPEDAREYHRGMCDCCSTEAVATDELGNMYCYSCLYSGDTVGVLRTEHVEWVEA